VKQIQKHFLLFSILTALVGCGVHFAKPLPKQEKPAQYSKVSLEPRLLAIPTSNGESLNTFSIPLWPSSKETIVLIPFHYETLSFSRMTVRVPSLSVENCEGTAQVTEFKLSQLDEGVPEFAWSKGWVKANQAKIGVAYDIEEDISPDEKETIVIGLIVPAECTEVSGEFTVQFR
jgi:hypothetical protein